MLYISLIVILVLAVKVYRLSVFKSRVKALLLDVEGPNPEDRRYAPAIREVARQLQNIKAEI